MSAGSYRLCYCDAPMTERCAVWCSTIATAVNEVKRKQALARDNTADTSDRTDAIEWLFEYGWGIEACG